MLLTSGPNSGKVLVAGGNNLASAELCDPAIGTFTATGTMATARSEYTATLLGDGTVLMAGFDSGNNILAAAELYNGTSGTFAGTGGLQNARGVHTATLLKDGTVGNRRSQPPHPWWNSCDRGVVSVARGMLLRFNRAGADKRRRGTSRRRRKKVPALNRP